MCHPVVSESSIALNSVAIMVTTPVTFGQNFIKD